MKPSLWITDKFGIESTIRPMFHKAQSPSHYGQIMKLERALIRRAYRKRKEGRRMFRLLPLTPPVIHLGTDVAQRFPLYCCECGEYICKTECEITATSPILCGDCDAAYHGSLGEWTDHDEEALRTNGFANH